MSQKGEAFPAAIGHPIRTRIFVILGTQEACPLDLAVRLRESLGVVSYHVRVLADLGVIEQTRTEQRRGATAHYYRARIAPGTLAARWLLAQGLYDAVVGEWISRPTPQVVGA